MSERTSTVGVWPGLDNPLVEWLLVEGSCITTIKELISRLAERMVAEGMPIARVRVIIRMLHPQSFATRYTWQQVTGDTVEYSPHHWALQTDIYQDSPMAAIFDGADAIRRRLDVPDPTLDFPILVDLVAEGATDYLALPVYFHDGKVNVITLVGDRPGGFNDREIDRITEMLPILAWQLEVLTLHRLAKIMLDTYLGKLSGERVLHGLIKRGDGERIHAVIWFCDLRDSTALSESLSLDVFLSLLNDFFDCMAGAVLDHGGEILRFIGDAALAIFPIGGSDEPLERACTPMEGTCARALAAARDAQGRMAQLNRRRKDAGEPPIGFGIGLHVGDVLYGNIGVPDRLEFTVIGAAANETARLEGLCKELKQSILISSSFPRCFPGEMRSLGYHRLRGVSEPQEVFTLSDC